MLPLLAPRAGNVFGMCVGGGGGGCPLRGVRCLRVESFWGGVACRREGGDRRGFFRHSDLSELLYRMANLRVRSHATVAAA